MNIHNIVRGAFLADAHGLGSHWVYNQDKLARVYPELLVPLDDPQSNYHPNRKKGGFTHFGDQMLFLLRSLPSMGGSWSLPVFREVWKSSMTSYDGYLDGASKETLENLHSGNAVSASASDDLSGVSRMVPLLLLDLSLDELIVASREQTSLTHGDPAVVDAAEFFARSFHALIEGESLAVALQKAAAVDYSDLPAQKWLDEARSAVAGDPNKAAADFGLTCHLSEAFPATLLFAFRWLEAGADTSPEAFLQILSENAKAGGDTSARAILLAALLVASGCSELPSMWYEVTAASQIEALDGIFEPVSKTSFIKASFKGANGDMLDARLEVPSGEVRSTALFAHCFTCGKISRAATFISRALAERGIATLRFDFTGLGNSDGDFANTSFLSNIDDLLAATDFLRQNYEAPSLLVGHSLGGAAVLAAAGKIDEVSHIATVGAPADPEHVTHLFEEALPSIQADGEAKVSLGGRPFTIGKKFLTDLEDHNQPEEIANLRRNLLILHSPTDSTVGIDSAASIYTAAKHPKSFISLPQADHLLTDVTQAEYVANLIATWFSSNN